MFFSVMPTDRKLLDPHRAVTRRQRPSILLVDDEAVVRLLVRTLLEIHFAAKVVEAASNAQAFRAAKRRTFDLVITDYGRSGGDGLAFLRAFKALYPGVPVVIHSGQVAAIRQRARRLGASACIQKMVTQPRLRIIERVLSQAAGGISGQSPRRARSR